MIGARLRGEYKGLGMGRMSGMALAAAYIVSPIDAVPEAFLLVFGLADDALVAAWLVGALLAETGAFLEWEGAGRPGSLRPPAGGTVIDGEVSGSERAHQG
jgi:uncharacterized membrane protein YkvA (DUF1232 family)